MSNAAPPKNCLVIGKAKTGTTALAHLLQLETQASILHMEPKGIGEILSAIPSDEGYITKIIFEHYRGRFRHLSAIVHNELYAQYDKVVFIQRDIRDEMVSRLLYLAKVFSYSSYPDTAWRNWVFALRQKEQDPSSISFRQLCDVFQHEFGADAWRDITHLHTDTEREFREFISSCVERDHLVIRYEDMIDNRLSELSEYFGHDFKSNLSQIDLGNFSYTKRSAKYGDWRSFFLQDDIDYIRLIISKKGLGQFDDWSAASEVTLNPVSVSEYVMRLSGRPKEIFQ